MNYFEEVKVPEERFNEILIDFLSERVVTIEHGKNSITPELKNQAKEYIWKIYTTDTEFKKAFDNFRRDCHIVLV